jgi:hypothetical protein
VVFSMAPKGLSLSLFLFFSCPKLRVRGAIVLCHVVAQVIALRFGLVSCLVLSVMVCFCSGSPLSLVSHLSRPYLLSCPWVSYA